MESDLDRSPSRRVAPDIRDWRRQVLEHPGFGEALAGRLAADGDFDLHDLLKLVDRGCPPELAARILAPPEGNPHGGRAASPAPYPQHQSARRAISLRLGGLFEGDNDLAGITD